MSADKLLSKLRWLGEAGFLIQDGLTVYIDPIGTDAGMPKADVVFLTHPHAKHCSDKDVEAVSTPATVIVGPRDCVTRFRLNQMPLRPGQVKDVLGLKVKAVAAYGEGSDHPRDRDWLGFVLEFSGVSLYHPGDSGWTPEMAAVRPDVLLWPVGNALMGGFLRQSLDGFLRELSPKAVVPMHYEPDAGCAGLDALAAAAGNIPVRRLEGERRR